jgi:hypothetical protein
MNKLLTFLLALTFLFLFSGLFSGCVTVEDVQKRLGTFHGLTENDLVQRWGIPSTVTSDNPNKHKVIA